jgi:WD40 repeat protein
MKGETLGAPLRGHTSAVTSVAISVDGKYIVSGSTDLTIRIWNMETMECIRGPWRGHTHVVTSVAFSTDGRHIVSGSRDYTIRVWDTEIEEEPTGSRIGQPILVETTSPLSYGTPISHIEEGRNTNSFPSIVSLLIVYDYIILMEPI